MLTTYLKRQATRTTYYTGFAGPYLDEFTDWLARCGFHDEVVCQYLRANPTEKLEAISTMVPFTLKRGRLRAPDKLIASLRGL